ncbi:MAG: M26 family metallopeptidase [Planctomycetota bacterium]|jgi:hypothetical protein
MRKLELIWVLVVFFAVCSSVFGAYGGGGGIEGDPYLIYDANQLNAIGANSLDWNKHFKLRANIDLSAYTGDSFNLIGNQYAGTFTGVFDGNGHAISNFNYSCSDRYYIGFFGYVNDDNAEIKNLILLDPNVDANSTDYIGGLIGVLQRGSLTNCRIVGGSVHGGDFYVGGMVGYNIGTISDCRVSMNVRGDYWYVGGIAGYNKGPISDCHGEDVSVTGQAFVGGLVGYSGNATISACTSWGTVMTFIHGTCGGLVGYNKEGTVSDCVSWGSVSVDVYSAGGLAGVNYEGTIERCRSYATVSGSGKIGGLVGNNAGGWGGGGIVRQCYSFGEVYGGGTVGGLVGSNNQTIRDSYSMASVFGNSRIGGLVGYNDRSVGIYNCYSAGVVNGSGVGGLIGEDNDGIVENCFWDVETSGQTTSDGGTGKTTAEMYTQSTFTAAGWDFNTPIWMMCDEPNYPKLWWEKCPLPLIEVQMKLTPQAFNPGSQGNWMKAHFVLPEGFIVEDVDANRPAVIEPSNIESDYMNVFINDDGLVEIEAAFDRGEFCSIVTGDEPMEVRVVGLLTSGQQFYGTDTIKIVTNSLKYVASLASRWLEANCGKPDWCAGMDLNQDSKVNFLDYALFDGCCIEVVRE